MPRDTSPLSVRIDALAPSYLPESGQITVRGTVTNRTDEDWSFIRIYTFMGDDQPAMQNPGDLEAAMTVPFDEVVGERVTDLGEPGAIDLLAARQTLPFTVTVPASAFDVSEGGAYWFGVHALGQSNSVLPDGFADGRARTFLPYVPPRVDTAVPTALVMPMIRAIPFADDGSLDQVEQWQRSLSLGGRLRDLLDFVAGARDEPITWVVDPALLDAVSRLAAGNPPRDVGPTGDAVPSQSGSPQGESEGSEGEPQANPLEAPGAQTAAAWLEALGDAFDGDEVLTLPYGNIDVPATLEQSPQLYDRAVARKSAVLQDLGVEATTALAAPGGYLDEASIMAAGFDTRVLVTDRMFRSQAPSAARIGGHRLLVTSNGAAQGSPGPGPSISTIGLRQRILAEAAVRAIKAVQQPLIVMLPTEWGLDGPGEFFSGLDVDWLDLDSLTDVESRTPADPIDPSELNYPALQMRRELDVETFDAARGLIEAGDTLQKVLANNDEVADVIADQALTALSYSVRAAQAAARGSVDASHSWVDDLLGQVQISASRGVTLSSASGTFVVTLSNDLDQPVTVSLRADSDDGITVTPPEEVELPANSRTNVLLKASTTTNKVHNVTLLVTDAEGTPLGSSDSLPIRSVQVSEVIWLIMGTGAGLLFLAIAVRLVRRIRTARRGDLDPGPVA